MSQEESTELRNGTACIIFIVIKIFFQKQTWRTQILPESQNYQCVISRSFGLWSPSETEWQPEKCLRFLKMLKSQRSPPGRGKGVVRSQPGCPPPRLPAVCRAEPRDRALAWGIVCNPKARPLPCGRLYFHTLTCQTHDTLSHSWLPFLICPEGGEKRVN